MKKSGFTLIELLVVIAIIAILAGIALPVFSKAMERGRSAQDLSNMRQLGIGSIAYLNDNNDQVFSSTDTTSWPVTLYSKYVTNWLAFKSPFDTRPNAPANAAGTGVPVSYGINYNILNQTASTTNTWNGNSTRYVAPSQLIFMADNVDFTNTNMVAFQTKLGTGADIVALPAQGSIPSGTSGSLGCYASRGMINVLFADAHVGSLTYNAYASPSNTGTPPTAASLQWLPLGQ